MPILSFKTKKGARNYVKFLKNHQKQFGVIVRPKIIDRGEKNKYPYYVIERARLRRR